LKVVLSKSAIQNDHRERNTLGFIEGLKQHGPVEVQFKENYGGEELHLSWGAAKGVNNLVLEGGLINNYNLDSYVELRNYFVSTVWRGNLNYGEWVLDPDVTDARVVKHNFSLKPYKRGKPKKAIIFGQCPGDKALFGLPNSYPKYINKLYASASKVYEEVLFRPHPQRRDRVWGRMKRHSGSIQSALEWADLGITYSSTSAIDCLMAGIPCIVFGKYSVAWEVTSHELEKVIRPPREQWLNKISYAQWTLKEITSGEAWEHLRAGYRL
jgi:hypothetical protein